MAKQKLTHKEVQLIKHLIRKGMGDRQISLLIGKVGRLAILKIRHETRWKEVPVPNEMYGEELLLRFQRLNTLDIDYVPYN